MSKKRTKRNDPNDIETDDFFRLVGKSVRAPLGEYVISSASAISAKTTAEEFEKQYRQKKSKAGGSPKKKKGIHLAAQKFRQLYPNIASDKVWAKLPSSDKPWELDDDRYLVYKDGEIDGATDSRRIYQLDRDRGKGGSIAFKTFKQNYLKENTD